MPLAGQAQDPQGVGGRRVQVEVEGDEADRRDARVVEEPGHGLRDIAEYERRPTAEPGPQQGSSIGKSPGFHLSGWSRWSPMNVGRPAAPLSNP